MTGLHYIIRERAMHEGMRVFLIRRSDEKAEANVTVLFDAANVTHCGSCSSPRVAMQRSCKHCDAVHRYIASQRRK